MSTRPMKRSTAGKPSMELIVEVASSAAAAKKMSTFPAPTTTTQPAVTPVQMIQETWSGIFLELLYQLRTRRSWVIAMAILGTLDMLLNLVNLVQMSADDLNYVLVIGPPPQDFWISLCFFTIVGVILYIPETINTISALYSIDGDTLFPFHSELTITLLLEHIPLSVLDYFITRSRRQYTTSVESLCAIVRLLFISIRLMWYAHIEGKKIRKNDKYELHQLLILVNYVLFSVAVSFPLNNWRFEPTGKLEKYHLESVSVYMLRRDKPPEEKFKLDITDLLNEQGWTDGNTTLVQNSWTIYTAYDKSESPIIGEYDCMHGGKERPRECARHGARKLQFRFIYEPDKSISPWGVISYNYAELCLNQTTVHWSDHDDLEAENTGWPVSLTCNEAKRPLANDWRLFFFATERKYENGSMRYKVSEPFMKVQTATMPKYNSKIVVCGTNQQHQSDKQFGCD